MFSKESLIDACDRALKAHDETKVAWKKAKRAHHAKNEAKWNAGNAIALRDELTKAIARYKKDGTPINRYEVQRTLKLNDLDKAFYIPTNDWELDRQFGKEPNLLKEDELAEITALREVLKAATGDQLTFTVNELRQLGLKNVGRIFTVAAKAAKS
jgi:hypothetical protein